MTVDTNSSADVNEHRIQGVRMTHEIIDCKYAFGLVAQHVGST